MTSEELKSLRNALTVACLVVGKTTENVIEQMDAVQPLSEALVEFFFVRGLDSITALTALLHAAGTVSMTIPPQEEVN